jgi:hypothetical protein
MIFNWTPEFINASLVSLTAKQRAALDCLLSLSKSMTRPGPARLKKYSFQNLDEYEANLQTAREIAIAHFAEKGIRHVDDLSFPEADRSTEGRIQKAAQKAVCAAAAA